MDTHMKMYFMLHTLLNLRGFALQQ